MRSRIKNWRWWHPEEPPCAGEPYFPGALLVALGATTALMALLQLCDCQALPPCQQLLLGQMPLVIGGLGGAWLGLRFPVREFGWRAVLNYPALPESAREPFWRRNLLLTCVVIPGSIVVSLLTIALLKSVGWEYFPEQSIESLSRNASWLFWPLAFFCSVVLAPITEEILFRHLLFRSLRRFGSVAATLLTATLFAVIHALPQAIPTFIFLGIMLQWACRVGTLRQAIALHASYNLIMFWLLVLRHWIS